MNVSKTEFLFSAISCHVSPSPTQPKSVLPAIFALFIPSFQLLTTQLLGLPLRPPFLISQLIHLLLSQKYLSNLPCSHPDCSLHSCHIGSPCGAQEGKGVPALGTFHSFPQPRIFSSYFRSSLERHSSNKSFPDPFI